MKATLQSVTRHPFSSIVYILYFALFVAQSHKEFEIQRIIKQNNGNWPYAVREWAGMPLYLFGIIFLITTIINGSAKSETGSYHFWLGLAILSPIVIYGNI